MSEKHHRALQPVSGPQTVYEFLFLHGRLPQLDLGERPYALRGWVLPYLLGWEAQLRGAESRYAYFLDLWFTGALGDAPIPRVEFNDSSRQGAAALKNIWQCISICDENGSWSGLTDFVQWLAFGLGVSREPVPLSDKVQERLYRVFNVRPWLEAPYDYLGELLCERKQGWNPAGFYPTPHPVCEMLTLINFAEGQDYRSDTVCDPAVGTGRMLLHASNHSLRLSGQDIDPLCCAICKINGALYAPWLAFGLPKELFPIEPAAPAAASPTPSVLAANGPMLFTVAPDGQGELFTDLAQHNLPRRPARRR
jgi:hypothetical protein